MNILIRWLISALSILIVAWLMPTIHISGIWSAIWVAAILALVNVIIRPILLVLTLPINIITLGLFTLVINALMVILVSSIVKGFEVGGFWPALLFSVFLSIISYALNKIAGTKKK